MIWLMEASHIAGVHEGKVVGRSDPTAHMLMARMSVGANGKCS